MEQAHSSSSVRDFYELPSAQEINQRSLRIQKCLTQLEQTKNVKENWDSYGAPAPSLTAIQSAIPLITSCFSTDCIPDDIGAMVEGGITVSFMKNNKYAAVEFYNSGEVVALLSRPINSDIWEPQMNALGIGKLIHQIRNFLG